jgi:hypothetical protein
MTHNQSTLGAQAAIDDETNIITGVGIITREIKHVTARRASG